MLCSLNKLSVEQPKTRITHCEVKRRPITRINRQKPLEELSCTLGPVNLTREEDLMQHQAGELHQLNLAVLQSSQGAAGLTAKLTHESSHPACNNYMESETQRSEQPKRSGLGQEREAEAKNSHVVQLMENETERESFGEERKAEEKDSHAGLLMKETGIQSSEQPKPAGPTLRDGIDEGRKSPHQPPVKEKSPSNEHKKRLVLNEVSGFTFNLSLFLLPFSLGMLAIFQPWLIELFFSAIFSAINMAISIKKFLYNTA